MSCCTCCSVYVDVVQARILRERTDGVTACVVSKMLCFFCLSTPTVAWITRRLLESLHGLLRRCCCLRGAAASGAALSISRWSFLTHLWRRLLPLPADHAYCTAVCQRVCHVQDSSRVSSISLRIWAEPEAATQREQGHGGDLQRVSIVQDSQLIMPIIQQRSSACVMYRKPLVCTP